MEHKTDRWVAVSGGFDPIHIGHVRMFEEAKKLGTHLVVILNNDNWLRSKKGFVFMPQSERAEIISKLACVDRVVLTEHTENDPDRSVCNAIEQFKPDVFANGGDRRAEADIPEAKTCAEHGIEMVFNVGGDKIQSSSWLTDSVRKSGIRTERPWGSFTLFAQGENYWLKTITVKPGHRTSMQKHEHRGELWMCIEGQVEVTVGGKMRCLRPFETMRFAAGCVHRIASGAGGTLIEIAYGRPDEADNIRIEDDYGRIS